MTTVAFGGSLSVLEIDLVWEKVSEVPTLQPLHSCWTCHQ